MKIRFGFVSNSSSSSFVINLDDITYKQKRQILDYNNFVDGQVAKGIYDYDNYGMTETQTQIRGFTVMDNGGLNKYLNEVVKLDPKLVEWDDE